MQYEKLTVCDENSWSARLCFLTETPFYKPITEVVLLTYYLRGCKINKVTDFSASWAL